jgi:hypothetical protein
MLFRVRVEIFWEAKTFGPDLSNPPHRLILTFPLSRRSPI